MIKQRVRLITGQEAAVLPDVMIIGGSMRSRSRSRAGRRRTPASTVSPTRLIAWKYSPSRVISSQHEVIVGCRSCARRTRRGWASPWRSDPGATGDEMHGPVLQVAPLIEVLVAREHRIDAVREEGGFERPAPQTRVVLVAAGQIERMMKEADLPCRP